MDDLVGFERPTVEVRDMLPGEVGSVVALLARGMCDNPIHKTVFDDDPERRRKCIQRLFSTMFGS